MMPRTHLAAEEARLRAAVAVCAAQEATNPRLREALLCEYWRQVQTAQRVQAVKARRLGAATRSPRSQDVAQASRHTRSAL